MDATGGCRNLHNEEAHNLYSSKNIINMIKSWEDAYKTRGECSKHEGKILREDLVRNGKKY
jgi:hypothetical protein